MSNPLAGFAPALQPPKPTQAMLSPNGEPGDIPVERVQDAIKAGFRPAMDMVAPDGSPGVIPLERAHEALGKGFTPASVPNGQGSGQVDILGRTVPETLPEKMAKLTPEQTDRFNQGTSMAVPETMLALASTSPVSTIAAKGVGGYLAPVVRGALKSAAGAEIGKIGGSALGGMFGENGHQIGGDVGAFAGGIGGPFVDGQTFAKLPFGLGRFVATDAETAAARATMKATQRAADVAAGLRQPPLEPSFIGPQFQGASSVAGSESASSVPSQNLEGDVFHVPEPNDKAFPGENPNYMASVPRSTLPDLAQRLKAGAGTQLQNLGKTVIYLPRGSSR